MTKNWIAANFILLIVAGLLGWQLKQSVDRFNNENNLTKIQPVKDVKQRLTLETGLPQLQPLQTYNPADFGVVSDKNIFSETRSREEKEPVPVVPETPPLQQKPILVGVAVVGSQRMASIIDPTGPPAGRRGQTKRIGDVYMGYTITDITEEEMVLESGNRREIIPLHDGSKRPAQGGKTAVLATRLVNFGGGGAGGAAISASAAVVTRTVPQPTPVTPIAGAARPATTPAQQAGVRPAAGMAQQPAAAPSPADATGGSQAGRVIHTPFGDYVGR